MSEKQTNDKTDFGFTEIPVEEKAAKVAEVFDTVSSRYDLMNDLMSLGVHRFWKRMAIHLGTFRRGQWVLDLAGGTGDLTAKISPVVGKTGHVYLADINENMLSVGRDRLLDQGLYENITFVPADAEALPFSDDQFDRIIIGFGLRNVTNKSQALRAMFRVLKPGGRLIILEFSRVAVPLLRQLYDAYSFKVLPWLGAQVVGDEQSYRYLVESIRMHPDQNTLLSMMQTAGFMDCDYHNLSGGIVAIHRGYKWS